MFSNFIPLWPDSILYKMSALLYAFLENALCAIDENVYSAAVYGLFYTCLLALVDLLCVDIFCFLVDLLFSVLSIVEGRY